jgi:hypothetical protein
MTGKLYEALVAKAGLTFAEAADQVLAFMNHAGCCNHISRQDLPSAHDEAVAWLVNYSSGNLIVAMAYLVGSAASWVCEDARALKETTELSTGSEIIVVGGWSENKAFLRALEMFGFTVITVKNGREATVCGLAANALWGLQLYPSFDEAYEALPGLAAT